MRPLPNKVTTKGAPRKDKQNILSTRCSPSLWEIVDSQEQETQSSQKKSTGTSRNSARKSNMSPTPPKPIPKNPKKPTPVKVHIPHKDQIPIWMHDFIKKVRDVPGDGYCGFRAVAVLRNLIVDNHQLIRYNLYKGLVGVENARYLRMINDDRRYKEVSDALSYGDIGNAPRDKWMTMSDMGFLLAQKFNQTVVVLSIGKSETYFPLCGPPPSIDLLMCLAYVNDNHFMALDLKDDCPIPPTSALWRRYHREDADT